MGEGADNGHGGRSPRARGRGKGNLAGEHGSGGTAVNKLRITNSIVLGSTPATGDHATGDQCGGASNQCVAHSYADPGARKDRCTSVYGNTYRRVGIMWPQWTNRGKTCDADKGAIVCRPITTPERMCSMPWGKQHGTPSTFIAQVDLLNIAFGYFKADDCGQRSAAVAMNPTQTEYSPQMTLSKVNFASGSVEPRARFMMEKAGCRSGTCDAYNQAFIVDVDGSAALTGVVGGTVLGPHGHASAHPGCVDKSAEWGQGYLSCPNVVRAMAVQGFRGRAAMKPVMLTQSFPVDVKVREDSNLGPGQAHLRIGGAEREIDSGALLGSIRESVDAFSYQVQEEAHYG